MRNTLNSVVKKAGLIFIMLAFGLFLIIPFANSYRLSENDVEEVGFTVEQKERFSEYSQSIRKERTNKWKFIRTLSEAFEGMNRDLTLKYQITAEHVDSLVARSVDPSGIRYDPAFAREIFSSDDPVSIFRQKGIRDYTGWIRDREYPDIESLKKDLNLALGNFNKSIGQQKGMDPYTQKTNLQKLVLRSGEGWVSKNRTGLFLALMLLTIGGSLMMITPLFFKGEPGIKNNGIYHHPLNSRGWSGILLGTFLIVFYILIYFFPVVIAEWILVADVASSFLFGRQADQWFLYGFLYTLAVLVMGIRFLTKYRHSRYQQLRTYSVIFFQLGFAFILPQILYALSLPEVDLKNIWPLDYSFFYDWRIVGYQQSGALGMTMMVWGIGLIFAGVPLFTYFFGKRWYCSWVCGCGGLAETAGDGFRQLSSKKLVAWRIERYLVHGVLVFAVVMTVWVLYTTLSQKSSLMGISSYKTREVYGFLIGSIFAGVVGTGFYPLMGNRVWCRFGCPLAAYLGLVQRFKSRFRITTNGGQCISCGNCSTYCEMGIDVRWYAQRGQNIIRSSCVGCGVCAAVCPRGVLKLENKKEQGRFNQPVLHGNDGILRIAETKNQDTREPLV
jgi:polyferredoxin